MMKKSYLLVCLMFLPCASLLAQFSMDSLYKRPHVVINGQQVDALSLLLLDKAQIVTLEVIPPKEGASAGREDSEFGTVEIWLKEGAKLVKLPELLNSYHFKDTVAQLPVLISFGFSQDKLIPKDQQLLAVSESKVRSVVIERRFGQILPQFSITKRHHYHLVDTTQSDLQLDSINHIFQEEARTRNASDAVVDMESFMKSLQFIKENEND
jgi:hypothetical protein